MVTRCQPTKVVEKLNRAYRLAYIYLSQRAHDHPGKWSSPGKMKLFHPNLAIQIMEMVPATAILGMPDDWTILEPIEYNNVLGERKSHGHFIDTLYRIIRATVDHDSDITEEVENAFYVKKGGYIDELLGEWDIGHTNDSNTVTFSKKKQDMMEDGRVTILRRFPELHGLPCMRTANYCGEHGIIRVARGVKTCHPSEFCYLKPARIGGFASPR
jgi:hypothetical protein